MAAFLDLSPPLLKKGRRNKMERERERKSEKERERERERERKSVRVCKGACADRKAIKWGKWN